MWKEAVYKPPLSGRWAQGQTSHGKRPSARDAVVEALVAVVPDWMTACIVEQTWRAHGEHVIGDEMERRIHAAEDARATARLAVTRASARKAELRAQQQKESAE